MDQVLELSLKDYTHGTELFKGLKELGFIVLRDHPIDVELLKKAYRL